MTIPADLYIGSVQIHLYSIFFALGVWVGFLVARNFAKKFDIEPEDFDKTFLLILIFGLVGARIFYVVGNWEAYCFDKYSIFKFWQGGLAFYGSLIGGLIGLLLAKFFLKINFVKFLDSISIGLPLGQAIGRLGNYVNQEAYGGPVDSGWKVFISPEKRVAGYENFSHFTPTFFYEAIGLLIVFTGLYLLFPKLKNRPLLIFGIFAVFSGLLRYFIENIRLDALMISGLMISQLAAIVLISLGVFILSLHVRKIS